MKTRVDRIQFAGLTFSGLNKNEVISLTNDFRQIVTVNAEFIVEANGKNKKLREIINKGCATFDGQIPFAVSRLTNRNVIYEKIAGSDLIFDICRKYAGTDKKVFLLGAGEDSNRAAVIKLKDSYQIEVEGFSPPYSAYPFQEVVNQDILKRIEQFKPDILFVGLGAVKQEFWIYDNKEILQKYGVRLAIGCGGSIDFAADKIRRAPVLVQKLGLEGGYRLLKEPKFFRLMRLFRSFKMFLYIFKTG